MHTDHRAWMSQPPKPLINKWLDPHDIRPFAEARRLRDAAPWEVRGSTER
jgi:hypothetical protein